MLDNRQESDRRDGPERRMLSDRRQNQSEYNSEEKRGMPDRRLDSRRILSDRRQEGWAPYRLFHHRIVSGTEMLSIKVVNIRV